MHASQVAQVGTQAFVRADLAKDDAARFDMLHDPGRQNRVPLNMGISLR